MLGEQIKSRKRLGVNDEALAGRAVHLFVDDHGGSLARKRLVVIFLMVNKYHIAFHGAVYLIKSGNRVVGIADKPGLDQFCYGFKRCGWDLHRSGYRFISSSKWLGLVLDPA